MRGDTPMDTAVPPAEEETRTETHCYMCQQELPGDGPIITSKCGVNFHEDCAKRVVKCPVCGENVLEHFLSEEAKKKMVKKDRLYTILIFAIPFAIIEVLIGIWSMMNHPSEWSIPPWMGQAFLVDVLDDPGRQDHRIEDAVGAEAHVAVANADNFLDSVAVVKLQEDRADDVVQPRRQTAARDHSSARLGGVEVDLFPGAGALHVQVRAESLTVVARHLVQHARAVVDVVGDSVAHFLR